MHQRRDAKRSALARDNLKKIQQLRTDELSAPTPARDDGHADAHPCDAHRTATTSAAQRMRNQRARGGALSGRGISMIAVLRQAKRNAAALGAKECTRCERVHVRMHAVCDIMWIPFRRLCSLHVLSAILSHPRGDVRTWLMLVCDAVGNAFTVRGLDESLQKLGVRYVGYTNACLFARPEADEVVRALARVESLQRCGEVCDATDAHLLWALLAPDTLVAKVRRCWRVVRMYAYMPQSPRSQVMERWSGTVVHEVLLAEALGIHNASRTQHRWFHAEH